MESIITSTMTADERYMQLIIDKEKTTEIDTLTKKAVISLSTIDTPALTIERVPYKGTVVYNRVHDWKLTISEVELKQLGKSIPHHPAF